ncbi:MAG: hypothetical protein U0L74_01470 [Paludibacteraceae bacterium]|nr:hypothetical protein [Paludibacteraceae bacterium]
MKHLFYILVLTLVSVFFCDAEVFADDLRCGRASLVADNGEENIDKQNSHNSCVNSAILVKTNPITLASCYESTPVFMKIKPSWICNYRNSITLTIYKSLKVSSRAIASFKRETGYYIYFLRKIII